MYKTSSDKLQVRNGGLPTLSFFSQVSVIKSSGGKPPFLTCKLANVDEFSSMVFF
jgi:hypothetical protein